MRHLGEPMRLKRYRWFNYVHLDSTFQQLHPNCVHTRPRYQPPFHTPVLHCSRRAGCQTTHAPVARSRQHRVAEKMEFALRSAETCMIRSGHGYRNEACGSEAFNWSPTTAEVKRDGWPSRLRPRLAARARSSGEVRVETLAVDLLGVIRCGGGSGGGAGPPSGGGGGSPSGGGGGT